MIYRTFGEIASATVAFFVLGLIFGALYKNILSLAAFLKRIVSAPKSAYIKYAKTNYFRNKIEQKRKSKSSTQIIDFFFVITFAVFYILVSYIFLDAEFRIFALFITLTAYALSLNLFSGFFSVITEKILSVILRIYNTVIFILLYPFFCVFDIIKSALTPIIKILSEKYRSYRFKHLLERKNKRIKRIFKN